MSVTREQFDAYAAQKLRVDAAVQSAIDELWDMLDTSDMEALEADIAIYLPLMADRYGKACAVLAADFYDGARASSGVRGDYRATTDKGRLWQVDRDVKYAFGAEFAYSDARAFLAESVKSAARSYGDATVMGNAKRDPFCEGYCSVPTNAKPCVFCIMKTLDTYRKYKGRKLTYEVHRDAWHNGCKCELLPIWKDTPHWVEGDYERYESMYQAGREAAEAEARANGTWKGSLSAEEVMAGMRKANGIEH